MDEKDTGMIIDQEQRYITVRGVEFGVGFLTMLVMAAEDGETVRLELMSDGTIVMHVVDAG